MQINNVPGLTPGDNNTGSLRDILFIPVDEVAYIDPPSAGYLPYDCLKNIDDSPCELRRMSFTEDTAEMSIESLEKDGDDFTRVTIRCMVPKDYNNRILNFRQMMRVRHFVITRDHENKCRLIGFINLQGEKYGATFKFKMSTGKSRNNYKGYDLTFTLDAAVEPQLLADITNISIASSGAAELDTEGMPGGGPIE